mgnify:CR=1 FL=1
MLKPSKKIKPYSPDFNELIQRMCDEINKLSTMSQDIDRALRVINTMGEGSEGDEVVFAEVLQAYADYLPGGGLEGCVECQNGEGCGGAVPFNPNYLISWKKYDNSIDVTSNTGSPFEIDYQFEPSEQGSGFAVDMFGNFNCPENTPLDVIITSQMLKPGTVVMGQLIRGVVPFGGGNTDLVVFSSVMPRLGVICK